MKSIAKLFSAALLILFLLPGNVTFAQKGGHNKNKHHEKGGNYKHQGKGSQNNKTVIINNHPGPSKFQYRYPKHKHHYHGTKVYYPKVYYPVWAPSVAYYRRWVYFPEYNFYWDNYSGVYVYWTGFFWIRTVSPPPFVINVNISKQRKYVLDEQYDDFDNVYHRNYYHRHAYD